MPYNIKSHRLAQNYPILILKKAKWSGKHPKNNYVIFINKKIKEKNQQPGTDFW